MTYHNQRNAVILNLSYGCSILFVTGQLLQFVSFYFYHSIYLWPNVNWHIELKVTEQLHSQSLKVTAVSLWSGIAGVAFFSTGSCSFHCTPRHGMVGNQCTALIKALTSCLHRKLTCLLLISCRSHSVCKDCSANHNMFINDNKKNATLSVRHLLSNTEIESELCDECSDSKKALDT